MKTTLFAAFAALALVGCGPSKPADARSSQARSSELVIDRVDDAWAQRAFALYGSDAVRTCLAAFHDAVRGGAPEVEPGRHDANASYRELLADFLCECARGQSSQACPQP